MGRARRIFCFRVTLRLVDPPIWRGLEVPASMRFGEFHLALKCVMGWTGSPLREFCIPYPDRECLRIGTPMSVLDVAHPPVGSNKLRLSEAFTQPGQRCRHVYDLGRAWVHELVLAQIPAAVHTQRGC